jgi:GNAT superfamily N-acetyltransferase
MNTSTKDLTSTLELSEMAAWRDFYNAGSAQSASECGLIAADVGGAVATAAGRADVLVLNRVIGIGLKEPATSEQLEELVKLYAQAGAPRFFLQMSPAASPAEFKRLLLDSGFSHYNNWVKLYRDTSPPPQVATDLTVRQIGGADAESFGRIVAEYFDWPDATRRWVAEAVGRPGWRHYLAFDGATPVATGALFASGGEAWVDFAATLPDYRGRGAQAALMAQRIRVAREMGCRLLVVETAEDTPQKGAPSFRNMLRFGFQVAYVRPNFIFPNGNE